MTFGRLEYYTRVGWVEGHAGTNLQDPEKFLATLAKRDVHGRFTELDDAMQPGEVFLPSAEPKPSKVPITRVTECEACGQPHKTAWECVL